MTCKYVGCANTLRKDNKTGMCQTHYPASPERKAKNKSWAERNYARRLKQKHDNRLNGDSLFSRYGITAAQYREMLANQGGVCAICRNTETARGKERLAVDHCHKTGLIRGLLCTACNVGLGSFKDDVARIKAAARYLTQQQLTHPAKDGEKAAPDEGSE